MDWLSIRKKYYFGIHKCGAINEITETADTRKKDPKNVWQIEMKISQYFFTQNRIEEALSHAKASLDTAPDEYKKEISPGDDPEVW